MADTPWNADDLIVFARDAAINLRHLDVALRMGDVPIAPAARPFIHEALRAAEANVDLVVTAIKRGPEGAT